MAGHEDWTPERVRRDVAHFRSVSRERPRSIVTPVAGQESVWDYPRPPRIEAEHRVVRVVAAGHEIASSTRALRVVETASPPCVYVRPADVRAGILRLIPGRTLCEWKGLATYWEAHVEGQIVPEIAWSYLEPFAPYEDLRDCVAFFPGRVDECWLGDERVRAQPGKYYGGWVTSEIVGPFKGGPGTERW